MKPLLINNLEVAKSQGILSGEIPFNSCDRLADILIQDVKNSHKIEYKLTGSTTKLHLPSLHLTIDANLSILCQRCLDVMQQALLLNYDYVISESEPDTFEGDDDVDWLEVSREMNLNELIEDELLMALPVAPTHDHGCIPHQQESGEKHNPFSVLKDLIK